MNYLGISISFTIGGLLIVAILTLNGRVIQNSGDTVLSMSAKQNIETLTQVMRRDMQRIGYNIDGADAIQSIASDKIVFMADVDDDPNTDAETITWQFNKPGSPVSTTPNPEDYKLTRTTTGSMDKLTFSAVYFQLSYFDKNNNATSSKDAIRSILVEVRSEAGNRYGNNDYATSFWEKEFTPPNLKLQDMQW